MRIAVTTPMGHVGRHVTALLIRSGVRPVLLTRHPDQIPDPIRAVADVRQADLTDAEQVVTATADVQAMYWVDPSVLSADPLADYAKATHAVVEAVRSNGIARVVFQSSVGAEKRHGVGEIDGLAATELALDGLGIDVCHLRCGYFFTNLGLELDAICAGLIRTVLPLDHAMAWVAPRDIAEVAVGRLLNSRWRGRHVQAVHGPADLTWRQVANLLTSHLGRTVRVERISDEQMRDDYLTAGMPPVMAQAVLGMSTGLRDGFTPEQPRTLASTTPTALAGWIVDELAPRL